MLVAVLALTIATASISWFVIERPVLKLKRIGSAAGTGTSCGGRSDPGAGQLPIGAMKTATSSRSHFRCSST